MSLEKIPCGGFYCDNATLTIEKVDGKMVLKVVGEIPIAPFTLTEGTDSAAMSAYGFEVSDDNGTTSMGLVEAIDGSGAIVHGLTSNVDVKIGAKTFDLEDTPLMMRASTAGSTKKFQLHITDAGVVTATEMV